MPNPFNKDRKPQRTTGVVVESVRITDSALECEICYVFATEGDYIPEAKRLTFTCPNGHENVIRGIEIE